MTCGALPGDIARVVRRLDLKASSPLGSLHFREQRAAHLEALRPMITPQWLVLIRPTPV